MPTYQYWATTDIGDTVSGEVSADSPDDAAHLLTLRGWIVRRLEEASLSPPPASIPLTDDDFETLASNVQIVTRANLPLTTSLRVLAEESPRFSTRRSLLRVIDDLEQGQPLETVFAQLERAYPRRLSALFQAGVKSGRLPQLLQQGLEQIRRAAELQRRVWFSLLYPLFLFAVTFLVGCGIIFGIVPQFAKIFDDFGTEVPQLTHILIRVSQIGWPIVLVTAVCVVVLTGLAAAGIFVIGGRRTWHRVLGWMPLIGGLLRAASLSGMFRMLSFLVEEGFPLPEAFRIAAAVNDDASLTNGALQVANDLEHGTTPLDAVRVTEEFPREVLPLFRWAENKPLFVDALNGAAEIYAARSQMNSGLLAVLLEPILIFGAGLSIALIVLALFMPLIKLLNDLA